MRHLSVWLAALIPGWAGSAAPTSAADQASDQLAREVFRQLIDINTTDSVGNVTTAAEAMAQRFRATPNRLPIRRPSSGSRAIRPTAR